MPRTLPAELEAVNNGSYQAVFRWKAYSSKVVSPAFNHTGIIGFKIANLNIEAQIVSDLGTTPIDTYVQLLRGAIVNGTEYLIGTSFYKVYEREQNNWKGITTVKASLIPKIRITLAGDDTYENVITAFCMACDLTAEFKDPAADIWQYQFLPDGKQVLLNDARQFLNMLQQKYLITASDQEGDVIQFSTLNANKIDATIRDADLEDRPFLRNPLIATTIDNEVRFLWRDENETIHYSGDATKRLHNLGYLESTASAPDINEMYVLAYNKCQVDLKLTDNDIIGENWLDVEYSGKAPFKFTEIFSQGDDPVWYMHAEAINPFHNTEGGALPSTIERVSNYTPLNTSGFNGNLDVSVNNLQALAERVDELPLGDTLPAPYDPPTATNDFLVGAQVSGVWTWVRKTLAQTLTILQSIDYKQVGFGPFQLENPVVTHGLYPFVTTLGETVTLIAWMQELYPATTNDGSNYWTVYITTGNGVTLASISTAAMTVNAWNQATPVTSFSANPVTPGTHRRLQIQCLKTGAPGPLYVAFPWLEYR